MHVHIGVVEFLTIGCYITIWNFFWRTLAALWSNNKVGQAMAFTN